MGKDKLINIKTNWKHSTLEYLIKRIDTSQDMSRTAVFERAVKAADKVQDWKEIQPLLSVLVKNDDVQVFTNFQANYDDEGELLSKVKYKMLEDLKETGLKILQSQYMLLLLQANYLKVLEKGKLSITRSVLVNEENVDMPEMARIFCEMMLSDKDCEEIKEIKKILVAWRDK